MIDEKLSVFQLEDHKADWPFVIAIGMPSSGWQNRWLQMTLELFMEEAYSMDANAFYSSVRKEFFPKYF
jgi:hypothetical protein